MSLKLFSFIIALIVVFIVFGLVFFPEVWQPLFFLPRKDAVPQGIAVNQGPLIEVVADNLQIPWEVTFLPNGELLITERPGRLLKLGKDKKIITIEGVAHVGEGGLLGLTLHPKFELNQWLYLYLTTRTETGLENRVERYRLVNDNLVEKTLIIDGIGGASFHDGGRMAFGPDGFLYITTGDAGDPQSAQDPQQLTGKILRLKEDGSFPEDNPFNNPVYSLGHRNVQGIAWDGQDRLWASEHGPSGLQSGFDELNLIEKGKNYGWPTILGDESRAGMEKPIIHSGASDTWAPASLAFWNGELFFGGLRGEALYQGEIQGSRVVLKKHFFEQFGRIRVTTLGPDGFLYLTTSNTDGRGQPRETDDKLLRVNLEVLEKEN